MTVDRNPMDQARRKRKECIRCGNKNNLATIPFRNRVVTLCAGCRVQVGVSNDA